MPVIKESSDALSPPVVTQAFIERAPRRRTTRDYVALAVATCGVGFIPVAPGTWGAAVGVFVYLAVGWIAYQVFWLVGLRETLLSGRAFQPAVTATLLVIIIAVSLVGTWAASRAEALVRRKDPGVVVVDEVAGQLITFLFVPAGAPWWMLGAGFIAFRVFDIWKPYPINRLEALESGLGIMADDVLAGAYAATLMALLSAIYLLL